MNERETKIRAFNRAGRSVSMTLGFIAGAAVLGVGIFIGAVLVKGTYDDVLNAAANTD